MVTKFQNGNKKRQRRRNINKKRKKTKHKHKHTNWKVNYSLIGFCMWFKLLSTKKKYIYIKLPGAENGIQYKWTRRYKFHFPSWRAKKNVCKPNERIYWRLLNGKRSIFNTHTNRINKQNIIAFEYETMLNGELCFQSNFIAPKCIM